MVDTPRTEAQLLTLFADNSSGAISEQDARDLIVTFAERKMLRTTYDDFLYPGINIRTGASAPTFTLFRNGLYAYAFQGAGAAQEGHFVIHPSHQLKAGTSVFFHVHWSHIIGAPTGNVKWQIEYTMARGYGTGVFPASTTLTTTQAAGAQYSHHITTDADMTIAAGGELEPDCIILGRIFRDPGDGADTFGNDAYLLHVDVHYQVGQVGTTEVNRPFTSMGY